MKIEGSGSASGSGSISWRHGSADPDPDPDPHQNVMDPQHCCMDSDQSPKVEPLLISSISYRHEHEAGDPEHEVEEEHGVLHTGGDVRESTGDPSPGSHSSPVALQDILGKKTAIQIIISV
jgi:hypothetical protein